MPIAKDIPSAKIRSGESRFAPSIRYAATVNDRTSEIAAVSERFAASIAHSAKPDVKANAGVHRGERVQQVILSGIFSLDTAAIELDAIAALRPRVSNPVRHIVLSYDTARGEDPTPEDIERDVKLLLRHRGFTDARDRAQRHHATAVARFKAGRHGEVTPHVAIVHGDTESTHVHVVVSTVAPNGAVNPDFRPYGANEHAAALIAQVHGWEIVIGRRNGKLAAEQARSRGASQAEIEALLRRDAPTLDRLRDGAWQPGKGRDDSGAADRRGGFASEYRGVIQEAFSVSESFSKFVSACRDAGVIVKYTEVIDSKSGRVLPRLAFADALDRAGDSGSRVGVTAKAVIGKYGPVSISSEGSTDVGSGLASVGSVRARQLRSDLSPSRPATSPQDPRRSSKAGESVTPPSLPRPVRDGSAPGIEKAGQLTSDERALLTGVLRRKAAAPTRSDGLDRVLAVLGFASRSLRTLRRRRRRTQRWDVRAVTDADRSENPEPATLKPFAAKRAALLARDAWTPAGVEARDRALADLDMRASYAAWKEAEAKKQLVGIRAARDEAYKAHQDETRLQLRRAWQAERLFRGMLGSMGAQGVAVRAAVSEAYRIRRSALLAARKAVWAAIAKVRPVVKDYAEWLNEQSGVVAERARVALAASARPQATENGLVARVRSAIPTSDQHAGPLRPANTTPVKRFAPAIAVRKRNRFDAIFDRSNAETGQDETLRRARHDAALTESARAEKDAAIEPAIVKAAKKILGAAGEPLLEEMSKIPHGPERVAAVMAIRDAVLGAGLQRRARRAVEAPMVRQIGRARRRRDVRGR